MQDCLNTWVQSWRAELCSPHSPPRGGAVTDFCDARWIISPPQFLVHWSFHWLWSLSSFSKSPQTPSALSIVVTLHPLVSHTVNSLLFCCCFREPCYTLTATGSALNNRRYHVYMVLAPPSGGDCGDDGVLFCVRECCWINLQDFHFSVFHPTLHWCKVP